MYPPPQSRAPSRSPPLFATILRKYNAPPPVFVISPGPSPKAIVYPSSSPTEPSPLIITPPESDHVFYRDPEDSMLWLTATDQQTLPAPVSRLTLHSKFFKDELQIAPQSLYWGNVGMDSSCLRLFLKYINDDTCGQILHGGARLFGQERITNHQAQQLHLFAQRFECDKLRLVIPDCLDNYISNDNPDRPDCLDTTWYRLASQYHDEYLIMVAIDSIPDILDERTFWSIVRATKDEWQVPLIRALIVVSTESEGETGILLRLNWPDWHSEFFQPEEWAKEVTKARIESEPYSQSPSSGNADLAFLV